MKDNCLRQSNWFLLLQVLKGSRITGVSFNWHFYRTNSLILSSFGFYFQTFREVKLSNLTMGMGVLGTRSLQVECGKEVQLGITSPSWRQGTAAHVTENIKSFLAPGSWFVRCTFGQRSAKFSRKEFCKTASSCFTHCDIFDISVMGARNFSERSYLLVIYWDSSLITSRGKGVLEVKFHRQSPFFTNKIWSVLWFRQLVAVF